MRRMKRNLHKTRTLFSAHRRDKVRALGPPENSGIQVFFTVPEFSDMDAVLVMWTTFYTLLFCIYFSPVRKSNNIRNPAFFLCVIYCNSVYDGGIGPGDMYRLQALHKGLSISYKALNLPPILKNASLASRR